MKQVLALLIIISFIPHVHAQKAGDAALRRGVDSLEREIITRIRYPLIAIDAEVQGTAIARVGVTSSGKIILIKTCKETSPWFENDIQRAVNKLPDVKDSNLIKILQHKYIEMPVCFMFRYRGDTFHIKQPDIAFEKTSADTICLHTFYVTAKSSAESYKEEMDSLNSIYEKQPPVIDIKAYADTSRLPDNQNQIQLILKSGDSVIPRDSLGNGKLLLKNLPDSIDIYLYYNGKNVLKFKETKWEFQHGAEVTFGVIRHYRRLLIVDSVMKYKMQYVDRYWADALSESEANRLYLRKHTPKRLFYVVIYPATTGDGTVSVCKRYVFRRFLKFL